MKWLFDGQVIDLDLEKLFDRVEHDELMSQIVKREPKIEQCQLAAKIEAAMKVVAYRGR